MTYEHGMSEYSGIDYQSVSLKESIVKTEGKLKKNPKALILASVASMIDQFNMQNIQILLNKGYDVDVACNFYVGNNSSKERIKQLLIELAEIGVNAFQIDFERNVFNVSADLMSLKQVEKVICNQAKAINAGRPIENTEYTMIHSHSPIGGIVGRIVAKRHGIKSIYTAHGFHFYQGGKKKNWLMFYPIEFIFSCITDVLITINNEDYQLAKKKFKAKQVFRVPGIGLNIKKFQLSDFDRVAYRKKLGVNPDDYLILSVGELNDNKNHVLVMRAVAEMRDSSVKYFMAGIGENKERYEKLIKKLGLEKQVYLLGFRSDIAELNYCADIFAFPSIREGLGMAALEALACGTPICGMNTRGINEYVLDDKTGFLFENNVNSCKAALIKARGKKDKMRNCCLKMANKYSCEETNKIMNVVYYDGVKKDVE
jgi:glycosyltransferase involved in cell wall biosynthesis